MDLCTIWEFHQIHTSLKVGQQFVSFVGQLNNWTLFATLSPKNASQPTERDKGKKPVSKFPALSKPPSLGLAPLLFVIDIMNKLRLRSKRFLDLIQCPIAQFPKLSQQEMGTFFSFFLFQSVSRLRYMIKFLESAIDLVGAAASATGLEQSAQQSGPGVLKRLSPCW